ncbi:MAG: SCP2 sterol-binding domain-containing protein [Nitrososphaerota archaeon]
MSLGAGEDLVSRIKKLAEENFPSIKDKLPSNSQVYNIKTNEGLSVTISLSNSGITVENGESKAAVATMSMSQSDLESLINGQLDGVKAFLSGRIKIQGDVFKTMMLNQILKGAH